MNKRLRKEHQYQLEQYIRYHLIRQRIPVAKAKEMALELVYQPDFVDLPDQPTRQGYWLEHEDRLKMLQACPTIGLTALHRATADYLVRVLIETRCRPLIRTRNRDVTLHDGLASVAVPRTFKNKKTVPLHHDRDATVALLAVRELHPWRDNQDAPMLPDPWLAQQGVCAPISWSSVNRLLRRVCSHAGVRVVGAQPFRRLAHNEAAASGASDHEMRLRFAHSPLSQMGARYTKLGLPELVRIMDSLQGKPAPGRYCHTCRAPYGVTDYACRHCGIRLQAEPKGPISDPDYTRLELAARMATGPKSIEEA